MRRLEAARAYHSAGRQRTLRDQEADVFRRVNATLRGAQQAGGTKLAQALADNNRLWIAVVDQVRDPTNALPLPLRASLVSVGLAVQRELACDQPDIAFLLGINEQLASGLSGG